MYVSTFLLKSDALTVNLHLLDICDGKYVIIYSNNDLCTVSNIVQLHCFEIYNLVCNFRMYICKMQMENSKLGFFATYAPKMIQKVSKSYYCDQNRSI